MTNIEKGEIKYPDALDQVKELIEDIVLAQQTGVNTPELEAQLTGLILRKEDLLVKNY